MVGRCPKNSKGLKGICCADAANHLCFCGQGKCGCIPNIAGAVCHDAQLKWCQMVDPKGNGPSCESFTSADLLGTAKHSIFNATQPGNKAAVCAKNCQFFDLLCTSAKLQAGCGGSGDFTTIAVIGALAVVAVLLLK